MQKSKTLSITKDIVTPVDRFFSMLSLDKKDIGYVYIYSLFNGLINLSLPLGIQAIIGLIMGGQLSSSWIVLTAVVTLGIAITGGLKIMQLVITENIQQRIFTRSAFEFAFRIPRFKTESVFKSYPPELVNRFFDTLTVQKGLPKILLDFSTSAIEIIFGLILISLYHPAFVVFGVGLITILALILAFTGKRGLETSLKESKYKYEVAHWLEEIARTMHTFKLAGRSRFHLKKIDNLTVKYLQSRKKHFRILLFQFISIATFKTLITAGLLILGGILVTQGQINLGQFVAAEIVIILIMASAEKLILSMETIYDVLTALEKIGAVTDLPLEEDEGVDFEEVNHIDQGIKIKAANLNYQFPDAHEPLLRNLNFEIKMGEKICIAGYNGSGKSTLLKVLSGVYENFTGSLTYNDIPRHNLNIESLRYYVGNYSVLEDLFDGTLEENISLGYEDITLQDVIKAANAVGLQQFIESLPQGFNTIIEPMGGRLSRTVMKKIILARGIVHSPRLLAMEEFIAKMEREDRTRIIDLLTDKKRPWTLIIVSNDRQLASKCDRVFVLKEGEIIDQGTFREVAEQPCFQGIF